MIDLQKSPVSKRLFAFLTDFILLTIAITGAYLLLSEIMGVDAYRNRYNEIAEKYETEFGVTFGLSAEEYGELSPEEQENYRTAVDRMNGDEEANRSIRNLYLSVFGIFAAGIVAAFLILDFAVPLILGDGRSLGKKLFGIGIVRTGFIRVSPFIVFTRNVIGKGVFEFLLPLMIVISSVTGLTGVFGIALLAVFVIAEIVSLVKSGGGRFLHDVLADTVAVDWESQRIFGSEAERDEYIKEQERLSRENEIY